MAKSEKPKKVSYKLIRPFKTQKKEYNVGDRIWLTEIGYNYLKSQKIVE